jgi:hypothetical protein
MEMKHLSPEFNELRNVILSSQLTSCFLTLEEIALEKGKTVHYLQFREHWIELYNNVYKLVSKMKVRDSERSTARAKKLS